MKKQEIFLLVDMIEMDIGKLHYVIEINSIIGEFVDLLRLLLFQILIIYRK